MVLVALCLRLAVVAFLYPERLDPDRNYWRFAGEVGRVAQSLAEGHGFGNPLFGQTGPTAMVPPVYPYLLAGIFEWFGVYTKASAIVLLSLGSLFSALTCIPVFHLARIGFDERAGALAGWTWAFFPYAIYFSASFIWPTILTTLLLSLLLVYVLRLEDLGGAAWDLRFGVLSGLAALAEPIVLTVLPILAVRSYYRRRKRGRPWGIPAAAMAAGFLIAIAPWFIRNFTAFHTFIPFRDGLGMDLYVGNNGDSRHFAPPGHYPSDSEVEMKEYTRLGELAYVNRKREQAMAFILGHPGWFVVMTFRRAVYFWTSFWSFDRGYLAQEPFDPPNIFLSLTMDVLALAGLWRAFRNGSVAAMPFALVLLFFPMIYYVTHGRDYYRRPIDPVFVVLAAYAVVSWRNAWVAKRQARLDR
jgi:Dolichyl-phosphate-mannose-protein mannosyltransferase